MTPDEYVSAELARVAGLIDVAYASVPRPSRVTKRVAIARDDEWVPDEKRCRELYAEDLEQTWQDLTDKDIEEFCSILPWLDDEGLRFYLPAFMSYALRRFPSKGHRAISDVFDIAFLKPLSEILSDEQHHAYLEFRNLYESDF